MTTSITFDPRALKRFIRDNHASLRSGSTMKVPGRDGSGECKVEVLDKSYKYQGDYPSYYQTKKCCLRVQTENGSKMELKVTVPNENAEDFEIDFNPKRAKERK